MVVVAGWLDGLSGVDYGGLLLPFIHPHNTSDLTHSFQPKTFLSDSGSEARYGVGKQMYDMYCICMYNLHNMSRKGKACLSEIRAKFKLVLTKYFVFQELSEFCASLHSSEIMSAKQDRKLAERLALLGARHVLNEPMMVVIANQRRPFQISGP